MAWKMRNVLECSPMLFAKMSSSSPWWSEPGPMDEAATAKALRAAPSTSVGSSSSMHVSTTLHTACHVSTSPTLRLRSWKGADRPVAVDGLTIMLCERI